MVYAQWGMGNSLACKSEKLVRDKLNLATAPIRRRLDNGKNTATVIQVAEYSESTSPDSNLGRVNSIECKGEDRTDSRSNGSPPTGEKNDDLHRQVKRRVKVLKKKAPPSPDSDSPDDEDFSDDEEGRRLAKEKNRLVKFA